MPLPALAAGLAIPAAFEAGRAIVSALPSKLDRENKRRLEELNKRKGMGLSGTERERMEAELLQPLARQQAALQNRFAATLAASGQTAGRDVAQLRRDIAAGLATGQQAASSTIGAADEQARQQKETERQQLLAARAQRRADVIGDVAGSVGELAGVAGLAAGAPPGTFTLADAFGLPVKDKRMFAESLVADGWQADEINVLQKYDKNLGQLMFDYANGKPIPEDLEAVLNMKRARDQAAAGGLAPGVAAGIEAIGRRRAGGLV